MKTPIFCGLTVVVLSVCLLTSCRQDSYTRSDLPKRLQALLSLEEEVSLDQLPKALQELDSLLVLTELSPDSVIDISNKLRNILAEMILNRELKRALNLQASYLQFHSMLRIKNGQSLLPLANRLQSLAKEPQELARAEVYLGIAHFKNQDFTRALVHLEKGLSMAREAEDWSVKAKASTYLLYASAVIGDTPHMANIAEEALEMFALHPLPIPIPVRELQHFAHRVLGYHYLDQHEEERAKKHFESAFELISKQNLYNRKRQSTRDLIMFAGYTNSYSSQTDSLIGAYLKGKSLEEIEELEPEARMYIALAKGEHKEVIRLGKKALEKKRDINSRYNAAEVLSMSFQRMGRSEEALVYHEIYRDLKDSILVSGLKGKTELLLAREKLSSQKKQLGYTQLMNRQLWMGIGSISLLLALLLLVLLRLKRKESVIKAQNKALSTMNENLKAFAHTISHDLKGPIRTAYSFTQILQRSIPKVPEHLAPEFDRILLALDQADELMSGILSYSKSLTETSKAHFESVDLNQTLEKVQAALFSQIEAEKAEIRISKLPTITGDPVMLHQIFQNLLKNAMENRSENRLPVIDIRYQDGAVMVKDNGKGISKEQIPTLFEPFSSSSRGGSGLGLSIVKRALDAHEATIEIESRVGEGTSFFLRFKEAMAGDQSR
ncbi:MAG: ATP-binding protein [Bacteroidota bacterium]